MGFEGQSVSLQILAESWSCTQIVPIYCNTVWNKKGKGLGAYVQQRGNEAETKEKEVQVGGRSQESLRVGSVCSPS